MIGIALIVFGVFRWLTRKRSAHSPAWMKKITDATPGRAAVIAAVLVVVNPKVLFICAAAGLAIGSAGLGTVGAWISVAFYVLVAASSVAPITGDGAEMIFIAPHAPIQSIWR